MIFCLTVFLLLYFLVGYMVVDFEELHDANVPPMVSKLPAMRSRKNIFAYFFISKRFRYITLSFIALMRLVGFARGVFQQYKVTKISSDSQTF